MLTLFLKKESVYFQSLLISNGYFVYFNDDYDESVVTMEKNPAIIKKLKLFIR